ncbi:transcription termination factor 1-like [Carcharodon carcharias]|uniref:transcription termination factor 1-like n=1 Tax=Carcharodon carcharias TaxID=13397 RepID=UPI001B7E04A8|nr:transcription termination factor 1-like [Carcharodon carcharias]
MIEEDSGMMRDVRHKKWKHSDNAKKKRSSKSLEDDGQSLQQQSLKQKMKSPRLAGSGEKKWKKRKKDSFTSLGGCDNSETATADTEQDLNTQLFVGNSEKKRKKKDHSAFIGWCDSSETVTVDTEQDLPFVSNSEKKRKKKKKDCSASLEGCDSSETVTVDTEQDLNTQLFVSNSEKKRKKKDHSAFIGWCDSSETVTVDIEQDLPFVGNSEKKRKKERHNSRLNDECDDSEVRNPRESDRSESKPKKKKKDCLISLEGSCDGSETVTVNAEQLLQNPQFVGNNGKKRKKRKKERLNSRSEEECDNSEIQNLQFVGNGKRKKEKCHPKSWEADVATQVSSAEIKKEVQCFELMENEGNQTNKKTHHSCPADETSVSVSAVKTKQILQSARLMDSGNKKKDHVKAVRNVIEITAKETLQAMQNPELMGGRDGHKKKRRRCSSPAEEGGGKYHCKSAEGGNDLETIEKIPHQEGAMSESVDIDTETSTKKCKRTKKKMQFENNVNRDASLNDSEIPQKSIKQPFENCSADLQQRIDKSFKKHKVKCSPEEITEKEAMDHSKAMDISDFAEITAEQTKRIMHTSSVGCQEAVKASKRYKQKKGSVSGHKNSSRTKNLMQNRPEQSSALSSESTLEVVIIPETITESNQRRKTQNRQKNKQQQYMTGSNNNVSMKTVKHFQKEEVTFGKDTTKARMIDKSELTELLKDFIPDVEKLTTETMYSMYKYDLPRFQRFKEEGIPIRRGRFTQEENQQLQKNLKELVELTGIQNEWELFHVPESTLEAIRMKRLKQNNLFCCRLAEGIPRPWKCVYQRAKKMYDPKRCKGRYTKEELEKLQRLQIVHGNHWKKIAELMDRTDVSVMGRAKTIKSSLNVGPWSKEEERALMKIMEEVMKNRIQEASHDLMNTPSNTNKNKLVPILREKLYKKIPWSAIADQMEHRNWMQCRQKWMNILSTKMSGGVKPLQFNSYQTKINLIKRLYLMGVSDVGDVDWEELCSVIGDVPPLVIQKMFYKLKIRYVPDWPRKSFGGIVDFLHEQIIPKLEAVLKEKKDQDNRFEANDLFQPQQHEFKLRDIFDDNDDEEDGIEKICALEERTGTYLKM